MNPALNSLLERFAPSSAADWENALREIVQELALLGLWRSKFYEHASFYGGTALRIFHGLPRYSEDLDFSLLSPDPGFELAPHLDAIRMELAGFGFSFAVEHKPKEIETMIDSAFIKGGTKVNLFEIGAPGDLASRLPTSKTLKIKLDIDTDPPAEAEHEVRTQLVPIPFQVKLFTPPCLLAGKVHAILCRHWKHRVKGRDFYDFVWYLGKETPVNLAHLQKRMEQTGHWQDDQILDEAGLKTRLRQRFEEVIFEQAKSDVLPFLKDADAVALWSGEFFTSLLDRLRTV